jgi:hypothetical protein
VIEPRNVIAARAAGVTKLSGNTARAVRARSGRPDRGLRRRHPTHRAPQEPERPCGLRRSGTRQQGRTEATEEGQQGVGARRSTDEAGEPTRGTRWREGRAGTRNRWKER